MQGLCQRLYIRAADFPGEGLSGSMDLVRFMVLPGKAAKLADAPGGEPL